MIMAKDLSNVGSFGAVTLDLSHLPEVYVLPLHLSVDEVHDVEEQLSESGATVTYDIFEARLILGLVSTARRAKFELQCRGVRIGDAATKRDLQLSPLEAQAGKQMGTVLEVESPRRKRQKLRKLSPPMQRAPSATVPEIIASGVNSETEDEDNNAVESMSQLSMSHASTDATALSSDPLEPDDMEPLPTTDFPEDIVRVVKLSWFLESQRNGTLLPLVPYTIYNGRAPALSEIQQRAALSHTPDMSGVAAIFHQSPWNSNTSPRASASSTTEMNQLDGKMPDRLRKRSEGDRTLRRGFQKRAFASSSKHVQRDKYPTTRPVHLLRETTSEHDESASSALPEMPQWVEENKIYACERSTPLHTPNDSFISELKKIKLARVLTQDEIGVRAYSTSIASLAAYPYKLSSTKEILALPGCDHKIAHLFYEWETTGRIQAVDEIESDPALTTLQNFYNIWGVGAKTARELYYDRNRKDHDDLIEFEWNSLTRVQQIGLKYYDEFELKISRSEVEYIASVVTYHAKRVADDGIECIVVGGYRRGRVDNGDVDIIVSHRNESVTNHLINSIVDALITAGWITHSLSISTANSDRGQQPVSYKFSDDKRGSGFDTLDKALVVWQDPTWSAEDQEAKNPNVHRRVDIIISPWRTVGCAVAGWTSGTTFQRDLRRYVKHRKGWKFDSSGVRERGTGKWVDLEGWTDVKTRAKTWQQAERRVFEGLGLKWREPEDRNTG